METWKPIVGWEARYEISDLGRVRRSSRGSGTFIGRIRKTPPNHKGYPTVHLIRDDGSKTTPVVHRLVTAAFLGPCPTGKEVNHKDGDKTNNALSNLEYVSASENLTHSYRVLGRKAAPKYGSAYALSKLKEEQVLEIVERLKGGETQQSLAYYFGVTQTLISTIKLGKSWSHLTGITR
jgi:hypothetical protein